MSTILKCLTHSRKYCIFFKKTVSVNFKFKTKQTNFNSKNTNMQRWWFLDEPAKHGGIQSQSITRSKKTGVGAFDRKWTFKVLVTKQLYANEKIAVVGDCETLGAWNPEDAILLNQTDGEFTFFCFYLCIFICLYGNLSYHLLLKEFAYTFYRNYISRY